MNPKLNIEHFLRKTRSGTTESHKLEEAYFNNLVLKEGHCKSLNIKGRCMSLCYSMLVENLLGCLCIEESRLVAYALVAEKRKYLKNVSFYGPSSTIS